MKGIITIMKKDDMKKLFVIAGMALIVGGTSTAYASNDFTFSFVTNVIGKKEFKLSKKDTSCDSRAATYRYNTDFIVDHVARYRVNLDGNGFFNPDYTGKYQDANGKFCTTKYNTIKKNTYTVNLGTKDDLAPRSEQIKGTGTIYQ